MEHVFANVPNTHVYLDDLLSGVSDVEAGVGAEAPHDDGLACSKFSMLVKEIKCLGFIATEHGMRPDEARCRELVE